MGLFDFLRKKSDTEQEILQAEQSVGETPKMCPRCGLRYAMENERCDSCGITLFVEGENFCTNPDCERSMMRYSYEPDEFFCDRCNSPTVVQILWEEIDPIMKE